MTDFDKFLLWEAKSRDTIDFKKVYVDIAGDLVAGLLLSQIIYWYLPDEHGRTKLRVNKKGTLWIAKGRDDWWQEIRITGKQFDRASNILIEKGILIKDHFRFDGLRMIHIRLDYDHFMKLWQAQLEPPAIDLSVNPQLPKGETRNYPKVKPAIDLSANPLTESTAKTTTDTMPLRAEDDFSDLLGNDQPQANGNSNGKPKMTEAEIAHHQTFGILPGQDIDPAEYALQQEIMAAGWDIWGDDVKQGIIYFALAVRDVVPEFALPNDTPSRKLWYKEVGGHLKNYSLAQLKDLYKRAIIKMREKDLSFWQPGSLTKWALIEVSNESATTQPKIDISQGFYV